ncbi:transcription factor 7-like 1-A isoform X2 [Dunckerocampus dactyliophorus]|uniref:transcription factor 7-like 1-A isoform X2 n=1 Tax=Dunckerocampus dactyliophorus TaxID=161453 RepID=UPI002406F4C6|nr:transcription factor 7-like 1-A isoform X2 [Dunckerocampus dactyliophorus]
MKTSEWPSQSPIEMLWCDLKKVCCAPLVIQPEVISQNPVGVMNSQLRYDYGPCMFSSPLAPDSSKRKRKPVTHGDGRPYIKKPPNAFMLFMKEQRPIVKANFINKDSATINKVLGQMWKSLTQTEQEKYFREAESLNQIHASKYPQWSCRDNYGKKKKRKWGNRATSALEPPCQAQTRCVTMVQTVWLQSVSDVCVMQEASQVNLAFSALSPSEAGAQMATPAEAFPSAPPMQTLKRDSTQLLSFEGELMMMEHLGALPPSSWPALPFGL